MISDFLGRNTAGQERVGGYFQGTERKNIHPQRILYVVRLYVKNEENILSRETKTKGVCPH